MNELVGQIYVSMRNGECYGGRRIHIRIGGLPDWLMSLIGEAGPFVKEASSYRLEQDGPCSILLGSTLVVATTERAPVQVPKDDSTALPGTGEDKP